MVHSLISATMLWLRQAPIPRLFVWSLAAAAVFVTLWLPSRWNGGGGITEWYLPLRPITPDEAAFLLKSNDASIIATDGARVTIGSRYFVLIYQDDSQPGATPTTQMYDAPATFDDYYSAYSVDRAALEGSMGRKLIDQDIHPEAFSEYEFSFSPEYLPFYFLFETVFLAILTTFVIVLARRTRSRWQLIHPFTIAQLIYLIAVPFYAPAFVDADLFFQRIALESIWLCIVTSFVFSLAASIICIVGHMVSMIRASRRATSSERQ